MRFTNKPNGYKRLFVKLVKPVGKLAFYRRILYGNVVAILLYERDQKILLTFALDGKYVSAACLDAV